MQSKSITPNRRIVLTIAVGVMLALSGCSALPVWDDEQTPTPEPDGEPSDSDAAASDADDVPDADPDADEGDAPEDVSYPDGYAADGVTDSSAAIDAHVRTMTGFDSYVFTYNSVVEEDGATAGITTLYSVDNVDERAFTATEVHDQSSTARYYEDDAVYLRHEDGDGVNHDSEELAYEMNQFAGSEFVAPLLDAVEFGDAELVETDDETFLRYTSQEVTDPERIVGGEVDEERIDRFDVTIVVDTDGAVRGAGYVVEADRNLTVELSFSGIDSTSFDRPDWFDEAEDS